MKKRSRFFVANIVLGAIFGFCLIICLFVMAIFHEAFRQIDMESILDNMEDEWLYDADGNRIWNDYESNDSAYYSLPYIESAAASRIGTECQGETVRKGYQFYELTLLVRNGGTAYLISDYLNLTCEGAEDDDVYMKYFFNEEYPVFYDSNLEIIPSCQTGTARIILEVKEGVREVTLSIYPDEDESSFDAITVDLP